MFLTLIKMSRFPPMTWQPRQVNLNHSSAESGQLCMPTQTDEASDHDFVIKLIYERIRIRLHHGRQQLIRARPGNIVITCSAPGTRTKSLT